MYVTEECFNLKNYGLNKADLAFTGIWVGQEELEFNKAINETEEEFEERKKKTLEAKNLQMNSEENPQGLIKNEIVGSLTKSEKKVVQKLAKKTNETNTTMLQNIEEMEYRQTIKIANANNVVPIKYEHIISNDAINLQQIYVQNSIIFVTDETGNNVTGPYNLDDEKVNYVFYIGDSKGNVIKHKLVYREPGKPDLTGFNPNTTFYVAYDDSGYESSVVPIGEKRPFGWYNYEEGKWANIVIRENGQENYYVWIPRYMYILNAETESAEVKLVDLDNYWMDEENNQVELGKEWTLPDAFTWENKDGEKVQIWGYWISKFKLRDDATTRPNIIPGSEQIAINNIVTNTNYTYEVYLIKDGKRVVKDEDGNLVAGIEPYETISGNYIIKGIPAGTYGVNIIVKNKSGVQVEAVSKEVVVSENLMQDPDLTGFNKATTYCVLYDANGNEVDNIPIGEIENLSDEQREQWYNYEESKWANIVVRESNKENYFVWIPRYEYKLNSDDQNAEVMLIQIDQVTATDGYQIPDAFTWNGQPIAGYWISKFKLRDDTNVGLSAAVSGSGDTITISNIQNGTGLTIGSYEITLIDEEGKIKDKPHVWTSTDTALGYYRFLDLDSGKYTISIVGKSGPAGTGRILGGLTQEIVIYKIEQPNLVGYNVDCTYIVTYNNSGTKYEYLLRNVLADTSEIDNNTNQLISGEVDLSKIADGIWYNYSEQKWANVVIRENEQENYFVWIPRYEYKLDDLSQSSTAILIPLEKTTADDGYQIPDAFTWNGTPISGYWISKFKLRE